MVIYIKTIGISLRNETIESKDMQIVRSSYLIKLKEIHLIPIFLNLDNFNYLIKNCNLLLLTGGDDINPSYYNEVNIGRSINVNSDNDLLDLRIIEYSLNSTVPLLGICRGMQSINVFSGGTLHQDIGCHTDIKEGHRVNWKRNRLIEMDREIYVNSYHHQSIKDLSQDYLVVSTHNDGTIEAIIHKYLPIIGVQWHPELLDDDKVLSSFSKLI